ncbi:cytidylate kinase-like family protein [Desulfobacula phenolica]|uniref:Cytidylate kinase-like family protein n=1 Tax=Desulfobacula phenolica TaxID=90732 RepID=A0A1H2JLG2_9BACT|nr:cytidylate kinase-like family protein [Desulfobacula phenolica]SDU57319.1 Cytidylate kinase-like family protein [Desulfobacula phenolica]
MNQTFQDTIYRPGYYGKKRQSAENWLDETIKKWDNKGNADKKQDIKEKSSAIHNICFSRQIGVGALEIADLLSGILHYRVIDREILECMTQDTRLTKKIIEFYDDLYPGKMAERFSMLIKEKPFLKNDYARQLMKAIIVLADTEPSIFVGRGTHLILPGNTVLSVRFVCSRDYRVDRLSNILNIGRSEAKTKLNIMDIEQHEFFKTVYHNKETGLDEFDLVINRDRINGSFHAARIVACAFEQKFGLTAL